MNLEESQEAVREARSSLLRVGWFLDSVMYDAEEKFEQKKEIDQLRKQLDEAVEVIKLYARDEVLIKTKFTHEDGSKVHLYGMQSVAIEFLSKYPGDKNEVG